MKNRILTSLLAFWASLIFLVPAVASANIQFRCSDVGGASVCYASITSTASINDISNPIPACSNMIVYFDQGSTADISIYEAAPGDDLVAEIEASTLVQRFTASGKAGPFSTTKSGVRFVVDAVETAGSVSTVKAICSNVIASGGGVPGLLGSTANDETLNYLATLQEFESLSEQVTTQVWFDPYLGSDTTGDGSKENPYFSMALLKRQCLTKPNSECIVKGRDRVFTHQLLTLSYGAASTRQLLPGETVTFASGTGTAEVISVFQNKAAVTWISGEDPRSTGVTTFSAGGGESVGTVTDIEDSLNGFPSRVFDAATDLTGATNTVISSAGHVYSNGDGPFKFFSANDDQVYGTDSMTEGQNSSDTLYICNVVAGVSFTLGKEAGCTNIVDFSTFGTGEIQLLAGLLPDNAGSGLNATISVSCTDNDRICSLVRPEFADSPVIVDGNSMNPTGAFARIVDVWYWASLDHARVLGGGGNCGGASTTPCYNVPSGGLFTVAAVTGLGGVADPSLMGWVGVENFIVQNLAQDCLSAGSGGKLIALNVSCRQIRNGINDRSQTGVAWPSEQAHNSLFYSGGTNANNATGLGGALVCINCDGYSEMGSDKGSGGAFNPNNFGMLTFIGKGTVKQDGIFGDNCVGSFATKFAPCDSPMFVQPGGEVVIVGPQLEVGGNTEESTFWSFGGDRSRVQMAKTVLVAKAGPATSTSADPVLFNAAVGGGQGLAREFLTWNVTMVPNVSRMWNICPSIGTSAADNTSQLVITHKNTIFDYPLADLPDIPDYRILYNNCGAAGGYTDADVATHTYFEARGVYDATESVACGGGTGPCFVYGSNTRGLGTCGTANRFLNDVCIAVDSAGDTIAETGAYFRWFETKSVDTAQAIQWDSADKQFRCAGSSFDCFRNTSVDLDPIQITLLNKFDGSEVACIPADVLGSKVCSLNLAAVNVGAR